MITNNKKQPTIISFIKDIPNLFSLAGLACSIIAIYYSFLGIYYIAMIGMIWAVVFDWADGLIARRMTGRTKNDSIFGGQLDVLIDVISYGVTPAILLLSYGNFEPIFLIGAFFILATSVIRLSYFSTFGLSNKAEYTGLALDNNNIIIVFIFIFESFLNYDMFSIIFYVFILGLPILNISQIKTPKLSGNPINVYILAIYTISITIFYGLKLLN